VKGHTFKERLDPKEWDFRGLIPEHLDVALNYELAREEPGLEATLRALSTECRRALEVKRIDGWSVLEWERWFGENWAKHVRVAMALSYCAEFPKPWMSLPRAARERPAEHFGRSNVPFRILTREALEECEEADRSVERLNEAVGRKTERSPYGGLMVSPTRRYTIELDWSNDDPLLKPILTELLNLRPPPLDGEKGGVAHAQV